MRRPCLASKTKRRRRKLKHGVLEEWVVLPQTQGAAEGAPQASTSREPDRMELELGSNQDFQTNPGWGNQPRELSLVQPEITEFFNSAPTLDRPTQHNLVTSFGLDLQKANLTSEYRESPRTTLTTSISPEDKQNCFGDGDDVILDRAPLSPMGDIIKDNTQEAMISASSDPTALEGPVFSE